TGVTGTLVALLQHLQQAGGPGSAVAGRVSQRLASRSLRPGTRPALTSSLHLPRLRGWRQFWWAYLAAGGVALWLLVLVVMGTATLLRDTLLRVEYGQPRTTHLQDHLGWADENLDQPTLITAVNNAGVIHAFILPG